jgi:hypothetical protein
MAVTCQCTKTEYCQRNCMIVGKTNRKRCEAGLLKPNCGQATAPGIVQMGLSFISSATQHVRGGMKKRPLEEVQRIFDICKSCEHYANGSCKKCGCKLTTKVSWAVTSCPLNPPKWNRYEEVDSSSSVKPSVGIPGKSESATADAPEPGRMD